VAGNETLEPIACALIIVPKKNATAIKKKVFHIIFLIIYLSLPEVIGKFRGFHTGFQYIILYDWVYVNVFWLS
jgi:hypothetical protein